jgi:hypothetical protein
METTQLPPKLEIHALRAALRAMDQEIPAPSKYQRLIDLAIWIGVGGSSFYVFREFGQSSWFQTLFPFVAFGFGMYFMHVFIKAQAMVQWPTVKQYVDRSRIEARLRELGA